MTEFLLAALSFPTLLYSIVLAFCVLYWGLAATGLVEVEGGGTSPAGDTDVPELNGLAAVMAKLGLGGVPVVLVLTLLSLFAWLVTYYVQLLLLQPLPAALRIVLGIAVLAGALVPATFATALVLRPVRRLLAKLRPEPLPPVLGRTGIVSTASVTDAFGMVTVDDGGAGLVLQARHDGTDGLKRGDRVVVIEYLEGQNAYRVMPESRFLST